MWYRTQEDKLVNLANAEFISSIGPTVWAHFPDGKVPLENFKHDPDDAKNYTIALGKRLKALDVGRV